MTAAAKNSSRCGPAGIGGDSLEVAALPGLFLPKLARAKARVPFKGWTGVTRRARAVKLRHRITQLTD